VGSGPLSAAELCQGAVVLLGGKAQAGEDLVDAALVAVAAAAFEFLLHRPESFQQLRPGGRIGQLPSGRIHLRLHPPQAGEDLQHAPPQRLPAGGRRRLRQVADPQAPAAADLAGRRLHQPAHDPQQRRLALAVGTDQADAVARLQGEADALEHVALAVVVQDVPGRDERHRLGFLHVAAARSRSASKTLTLSPRGRRLQARSAQATVPLTVALKPAGLLRSDADVHWQEEPP
jgi:hypothetical protein